jgi:phenylacetate-CoA ligase
MIPTIPNKLLHAYEKSNPQIVDQLVETIRYVHQNCPFYKRLLTKRLRNHELNEGFVREFFTKIPFSSKEDVVRNYPDGFLAVPRSEVVAYFESSGTSGNTVGSTRSVSCFTQKDLERDLNRRYSKHLGLSRDDIVAVALPYALTSSAYCFHRAAQESGAMTIGLDSGSVLSSHQKHLEIIKGIGVTVLVCSMPLVYSTMVEAAKESLEEWFGSVRAVQLCGVSTMRNGMRKISEKFKAQVYNTYGLSEFGATTHTCEFGNMHVYDTDFYIEVIDLRTGDLVEDEHQGGEIVITTLTREASPKLRYRTGDFGFLSTETCQCQSSSPILRVKGRLKDAVKLGERFWMPIDFEEILMADEKTTGMYKLVYEPKENGEGVMIKVSADVQDVHDPELKERLLAQFHERISKDIALELNRTGMTHEEFLDQSKYSAIRSMKTISLDDRRPEEWLVSY